MRLKNTLLVLLLVVFCQRLAVGQEPEKYTAEFFPRNTYDDKIWRKKKLRSFEILPGKEVVFEYITDNGGTDPGNFSNPETRFYFKIPKGLKKFHYEDDELQEIELWYFQHRFCADRGLNTITKGSVKGELQANGSWLVEFDLSYVGRITGYQYYFDFSQTFTQGAE